MNSKTKNAIGITAGLLGVTAIVLAVTQGENDGEEDEEGLDSITFSNLVAPDEVNEDELFALYIDATNTNSVTTGTYLYITGDLTDAKKISIDANSTETIKWSLTIEDPGTYNISVGGIEATIVVNEVTVGEITDGESSEGEVSEEESTEDISISKVVWTSYDYYFTDNLDEAQQTQFFVCKISLTSENSYSGTVTLSADKIISAVELLREDEYNEVLDELDETIASYDSDSFAYEMWTTRKAYFKTYPEYEGFYIDYRWKVSDEDDMTAQFLRWIQEATESISFSCDIDSGSNTITAAFFKTYLTEITDDTTVVITIKDDDGNTLISGEVSLPSS